MFLATLGELKSTRIDLFLLGWKGKFMGEEVNEAGVEKGRREGIIYKERGI
jgi:hypothetical protein